MPCRDRDLQEAPDATRKSACPAVTMPTKKHQTPLASPLAQLSPCPPRGTRRHSQVRLALSLSPSSSYLTGAVTVRHKLVLPPTLQLLYATSWYCHQRCSYCTPHAGTATSVAVTVRHKLVLPPTVQLLYATNWYCHQQCSYCTPQAGTVTNGAVTVHHKLVLPPIKPRFVFRFCHPNKGPSLL